MSRKLHPRPEELRLLLEAKLESARAEELMNHLSSCEACLLEAEEIWPDAAPYHQPAAPPLSPEDGARLEAGVLRRLHRAALAEHVTDLSSRGFLAVFLELLRPLMALLSLPGSEEKRR